MRRSALVLLSCVLLPLTTRAGARRFTYVYETTTGAAGSVDIENWITFSAHEPDAPSARAVAFRHEIEVGLTDHLQASVYVADWEYDRDKHESNTRYSDSALELIYNFTNPVTDPLGLAVYQEYQIGRRFFEWESKVIAQKNVGRVVAAYNASVESEWERESLREQNVEFQQSLGLSYELHPRVAVGAEFVHELAFPDSDEMHSNFFAGPNVSIRGGRVFATLTALAQLTRTGVEPDLQLRTIIGVMF